MYPLPHCDLYVFTVDVMFRNCNLISGSVVTKTKIYFKKWNDIFIIIYVLIKCNVLIF